MSAIRHFIEDAIKKTGIDEFLWSEFERAGYGGVDVTKTPLGTNLVIYATRPGIVIGRGGETIKELARVLEERFSLPNPQVSVSEIEVPELNANVMASRISTTLKRGIHHRRAGFWALNQIMEAGALGAEIIISGKLRTERSRSEKFRNGFVPKSGEPSIKAVRRAVVHTQLKQGIFGIRVAIMPPDFEFPDQVKFIDVEEKPSILTKNTEEDLKVGLSNNLDADSNSNLEAQTVSDSQQKEIILNSKPEKFINTEETSEESKKELSDKDSIIKESSLEINTEKEK